MNIEKIKKFLLENSYPAYRVNQIEKAVYENFCIDFSKIKELPVELREKLSSNFKILSFKVEKILESNKKDSYKALLKLKDDYKIETALLKSRDNDWTICISSQVGCPVKCKFCLSGKFGLKRNLNYEEISDQVLFWGAFLEEKNTGKIKSIVYMGMGEPFLNYDNLIESIKILNDKIKIGKRHISVSTIGHIPSIRRFAKEMPQINLAISLHSGDEQIRNSLVPFNIKYPLNQIAKAIKDYIEITGRKIFVEYIMLKDINDRPRDARKLIEWIKSAGQKKFFTINLIPYNETGSNFKSSDIERILKFQKFLIINGIETTIRKSLGSEIKGACGQLSGNY